MKIKKRRPVLLLFSLVILATMSVYAVYLGIEKYTQSNNDFLIQSTSCVFPCWEDITPKETSFEDALTIIEKKKQIEYNTEKEIGFYANGIHGTINKSSDGMVSFIIFDTQDQDTKAKSLIAALGSPEKILVGIVPNLTDRCYAYLFFPKSGIVAEFYVDNRIKSTTLCQINLSPENKVFRMVLLGHNFYDHPYLSNDLRKESDFIQWNGYGKYP